MGKGKIYVLICPIDKKIRYVGQTTQTLKKRLSKHLYHINENNNHKNNWLKKLRKASLLQNIEIELLEECSIDILDQREVFWIAHFKSLGLQLTNVAPGGKVGSRGYKHTEEAKKIISEAGKGLTGIKRSKETRKKISLSLIGKPGRNTGNKHSKKTKNKISKTKKGTLSWNATPILQFKKNEFLKEWQSAHDAAKNLGLSQGNIWSVINGDRKTCGGYIWKLSMNKNWEEIAQTFFQKEFEEYKKKTAAGRRPDSVEFTTIDNDVKRRDLTINALFYDIDKGEVVDLVGGVDDLRNNIVRTVGKAEERFEEDPLRIMRFFRFSAQAGKLDEKADESLRKSVPLLGNVSKERIRDEFLKGIKSAKSVVFFLSIFKKYDAFRFLFGDLIIRDDFIEERDYNVLIAYLLQDNPVDKTKMVLNAHRYSIEEVARVAFLMSLKTLSIQSAPRFKKLQKNSHLTNEQIVTYAKWTGLQSKLIDAFLKFELSVSGNEYLAQGLKGKDIATAIEKQEIENFTKLL